MDPIFDDYISPEAHIALLTELQQVHDSFLKYKADTDQELEGLRLQNQRLLQVHEVDKILLDIYKPVPPFYIEQIQEPDVAEVSNGIEGSDLPKFKEPSPVGIKRRRRRSRPTEAPESGETSAAQYDPANPEYEPEAEENTEQNAASSSSIPDFATNQSIIDPRGDPKVYLAKVRNSPRAYAGTLTTIRPVYFILDYFTEPKPK